MDRDHILTEIRRLAEENGGTPLGRKRFEQETGIRESDWSGRHWSRWSDAIAEAGYQANELQGALPEEEILGALALAVRDAGRFPTRAEMQLRRRTVDGFPSPNVYVRYGGKASQIAVLRKFCFGAEEFTDVIDLLPATAPEVIPPKGIPAKVTGIVYLMRMGKYHKIGRSNSLGRRAYEISLQMPERVETVHVIETDDPAGIERYWHQRFADQRANGEWFELSRADVAAFKRRSYM